MLAGGVVGPPLFFAVFAVTSLVPPAGYDPLRHTVSAFALGAYGWVQTVSFLLTGGLVLAFAFGMRQVFARDGGGRLVAVVVGLVGVGLVGSGIFAADPVSAGATAAAPYPPGVPFTEERTVHGVLHDIFGFPVFVGLPVACGVVAYRLAAARRRGWAVYSAGTAVVFVTGFALTSMALAPVVLPPVGGLLQRLTLAAGLAWLAALAAYLLRSAPAGTSTRPHPRRSLPRL